MMNKTGFDSNITKSCSPLTIVQEPKVKKKFSFNLLGTRTCLVFLERYSIRLTQIGSCIGKKPFESLFSREKGKRLSCVFSSDQG